MKKRIQRTLFWFRDGEYGVDELGNQFFPLATLLNNLINEKYEGRKLQFINFNFSTEATYQLYPAMPRDSFYWGGGKDINFDAWIDLDEFSKKDRKSQELFLWEKSRVFFEQIAKKTKMNRY